jgi:hypothetical protein
MADKVVELHGVRILDIATAGPVLQTDRDAVTLIGDALGHQASLVMLPTTRLDDTFFDLSTRIAGEFFQKFVNYGVRLVIVGDIAGRIAESKSLRDFVRECNQGQQIWFVATIDAAVARLNAPH